MCRSLWNVKSIGIHTYHRFNWTIDVKSGVVDTKNNSSRRRTWRQHNDKTDSCYKKIIMLLVPNQQKYCVVRMLEQDERPMDIFVGVITSSSRTYADLIQTISYLKLPIPVGWGWPNEMMIAGSGWLLVLVNVVLESTFAGIQSVSEGHSKNMRSHSRRRHLVWWWS